MQNQISGSIQVFLINKHKEVKNKGEKERKKQRKKEHVD